jgi:hypothetical protein
LKRDAAPRPWRPLTDALDTFRTHAAVRKTISRAHPLGRGLNLLTDLMDGLRTLIEDMKAFKLSTARSTTATANPQLSTPAAAAEKTGRGLSSGGLMEPPASGWGAGGYRWRWQLISQLFWCLCQPAE